MPDTLEKKKKIKTKEKLDSLYDKNTWVKTNNRQQMFRLSEPDFKITIITVLNRILKSDSDGAKGVLLTLPVLATVDLDRAQ